MTDATELRHHLRQLEEARRVRSMIGDGQLGGRSGLPAPVRRKAYGISTDVVTQPEPLTNGGQVVGDARYIRVETLAHTADGALTFGSVVDSEGWDTASPGTFPTRAYYDVHFRATITGTPDTGANWALRVNGVIRSTGDILTGGVISGVIPTLGVEQDDTWSLEINGCDLAAGQVTTQLIEHGAPEEAAPEPTIEGCGEFYEFTSPDNLSLAGCDVQAGDLLLIAAAHTQLSFHATVLDVTTAGVTQLYRTDTTIGSSRRSVHGVWALTAGASTQADGIDYTHADTASGQGRIDVFVLRGFTLDTYDDSGIPTPNGASVPALAGGTHIIDLGSPGATGTAGPATIAGLTAISGDSRIKLFDGWDGTAVSSSGAGWHTAIGVKLI